MIPDEIPEAPGSVPGHNSGSMLEDMRSQQATALYDTEHDGKTFAQRKAEFLASAAAQKVRNRQTAGDAGDTIKMAIEVWRMIEADRRARTDPFYAVHRELSAQAQQFWDPVNEAMGRLREQIDAWSDEEDRRVAAQREEQAREMAAWREPASPPPDAPRPHLDYAKPEVVSAAARPTAVLPPRTRSRIRGDLGSTISSRQVFDYEVEDVRQLPDHVLNSPVVIDAIIAFVKGTVKFQGVPPGVRAIPRTNNQIR